MDEELNGEYLNIAHTDMGFTMSPYYSGANTPIEGGGDMNFSNMIENNMFLNTAITRPNFFPENLYSDPNFFFRSTPTSPRRNQGTVNGPAPAPTPNNGFQPVFILPRLQNSIYSAPVSPRTTQRLQDETSLYLNDFYLDDMQNNVISTDNLNMANTNLENYNSMMFNSSIPSRPNISDMDLSFKNQLIPTIAFNNIPQNNNNQMLNTSNGPNDINSYFSLNNSAAGSPNHENKSTPAKISEIKKEGNIKGINKNNNMEDKINKEKTNKVEFLKPMEYPRINELKTNQKDIQRKDLILTSSKIQAFFKQDTPSITENEPLEYEIMIMGIPPTGIKSRVETQVKICLKITRRNGSNNIPWTHLRLPPNFVVGQKDRRKNPKTNIAPQEDKIVNLRASVVCASDTSKKVLVCLGCIQRERKRKNKKNGKSCSTPSTTPNPSLPCSPGGSEEKEMDSESVDFEQKRIITFNSSSLIDLTNGDVILPTRLTCYCRHHKEAKGFLIKFQLYDENLNLMATGITPPIMITDDHKTKAKLHADNIVNPKSKIHKKFNHHVYNNPLDMMSELMPNNNMMPIMNKPGLSLAPNTILPYSMTIQPNYNIQAPSIPTSISQNTLKAIKPNKSPKLARIIPNHSPLHGGIEVALLGTNFREGMKVFFGQTESTMVTVWSDQSALCLVPSAQLTGSVNISIQLGTNKSTSVEDDPNLLEPNIFFQYKDNSDQDLMELALQVVGIRKSGRVEPAKQIALRIIQDQNQFASLGNINYAQKQMKAPAPPTTPTKDA